MMDNKELWKRVFTTDPRAVKPITGKQYSGNSPKPYWLIERATDEFGPVGIGWGVIVKSERFERLSETDVLHVAVVSVWYVVDGKRTETFDQMGGTKAAYKTAKGTLMIDEDAGKKSVTDGMVKCLSMIGFAGDIFSGLWDDSKYVEWAGQEWAKRDEPEVTSRQTELLQLADYITESHAAGKELDSIRVWYDPKTWDSDNPTESEERKFVWNRLDSKVRSMIKRNHPDRLKEAA